MGELSVFSHLNVTVIKIQDLKALDISLTYLRRDLGSTSYDRFKRTKLLFYKYHNIILHPLMCLFTQVCLLQTFSRAFSHMTYRKTQVMQPLLQIP